MSRQLVSSGSPLEPEIGFSRAVRVDGHVAIAGTAPIADRGGTACPGDLYGQTRRCLEIIETALGQAGASLHSVIRTRIVLTDMTLWREAARAHGEVFRDVNPACTFVEVSGFIDRAWLIEIEADAVQS